VILTYTSWRNRFGGDIRIVGQSAMIAGHQREIVGVLRRDFIFPAEGLVYPYGPSGRPNYEFLTVKGSGATRGTTVDPLVRLRVGVTPGWRNT
jgi:hypothetical protein